MKEVITMPIGIIVPSDERKSLVIKEFHSLDDYQTVVGGWIEGISLGESSPSFFANDEAKLIGMEFNWRATICWWLHLFPDRTNDVLCGDVVLVGPTDEHGETQNAPESLQLLLLTPSTFVVEVKTHRETAWQRVPHLFAGYFDAASWGLDFAWRRLSIERIRVITTA